MAGNKKSKLTTVEIERLKGTSIQHRLDIVRELFSSFDGLLIDGALFEKGTTTSSIEMVYEKGKLQNKIRIKVQ